MKTSHLCGRLLALDDRNFHGWAYWRWLSDRAQVPPEESLAFTDAKLRDNFSNYSAWHTRTALLAAAAAPPPVQTLEQLLAGDGSAPAAQPGDCQHSSFFVPTSQAGGAGHVADLRKRWSSCSRVRVARWRSGCEYRTTFSQAGKVHGCSVVEVCWY